MISMSEVNKNVSQIKKQSNKIIISYSFGTFALDFLGFYTLYFFFYETEVLLGLWYIVLANIIFAIWNAVNDPLLGYLTDRPFRFTRKWGKRFPWIMASGIPIFITYILLFSPPNIDPQENALILFFWLLIVLCISDTLFSIWQVHLLGLYPDKFRTDKDRRKSALIMSMMGQVGYILALLLPPMLYKFGDKTSYAFMAVLCSVIGIVSMIIMIPGVREDKEMIDRYFRIEEQIERPSFIRTMRTAVSHKNFVVFIVVYLLLSIFASCATLSVPFFVKYILGMEAIVQMIILAGLLLGLLGSMPLWIKLAKKYGFRKIYLASPIAMVVLSAPMLFVSDIFGSFIFLLLIGIGTGGTWVMHMPIFSDVIDEIVVKTGIRQEGVYMGIRSFIARFSIIAQTLIFAVVQTLTGFIEEAPIGTDTQPASAIWGIRVHFVLIPMIVVLIAAFIIWFFYDITEEKKQITKAKLEELKL